MQYFALGAVFALWQACGASAESTEVVPNGSSESQSYCCCSDKHDPTCHRYRECGDRCHGFPCKPCQSAAQHAAKAGGVSSNISQIDRVGPRQPVRTRSNLRGSAGNCCFSDGIKHDAACQSLTGCAKFCHGQWQDCDASAMSMGMVPKMSSEDIPAWWNPGCYVTGSQRSLDRYFEPVYSDLLIPAHDYYNVFVPCSNYSDEDSWNEEMAHRRSAPVRPQGECTWTGTCMRYDSSKCYQPLKDYITGDGHDEDPPGMVSVSQDSPQDFLDSFSINDCTTDAARKVIEKVCEQEYSSLLLKAFDSRQNCNDDSVYLYTLGAGVYCKDPTSNNYHHWYAIVNDILNRGNRDELDIIMPFVKRLTSQLQTIRNGQDICGYASFYHGQAQTTDLSPFDGGAGTGYWVALLSTTEDKEKAEEFSDGTGIVYEFRNNDCQEGSDNMIVADIRDHSAFPGDSEILFAPYTRITPDGNMSFTLNYEQPVYPSARLSC